MLRGLIHKYLSFHRFLRDPHHRRKTWLLPHSLNLCVLGGLLSRVPLMLSPCPLWFECFPFLYHES